ncbi:hypothetical protein ACSBR2_009198 [Camellia fascicularis]
MKEQKEICSFIRVNHLSLLGIVEAKIRPSNLSSVTTRCFLVHWQYTHNAAMCLVARILVGWDPSKLSVLVLSCSD